MATSDAQAIGLEFSEAVDFFRGKARVPTEAWHDVWRTAHSRSFMVAGATSDALLADFQSAIAKAVQHGTTLAEFRKDFDSIVEKHGWEYNGSRNWRSRVIYETNLATSYAAGRYAQLTDPDTLAAFPYWEYLHSGSAHPRLQHLAWNGLTLRADDAFWATHYPPNGWRCGCRVRPIDAHGLRAMGKSGPDQAPPIETREWRNPKTGEVHQVPVGIDPGWHYNPGLAWKGGMADVPLRAGSWREGPAPGDPRAPGAEKALPALPSRLAAFLDEPRGVMTVGPLPAPVSRALGLPATHADLAAEALARMAPMERDLWGALPELVTRPTVALMRDERRTLLLRQSGRVLAAELVAHPDFPLAYIKRFWRVPRAELLELLAAHDLVFGDADNLDEGEDAE